MVATIGPPNRGAPRRAASDSDQDSEVPTAVESRAPVVLAAGTVLGRYVVLEHIGAGGLGDVHAAYDPQLDRKIALKLLRPDPHVRKAFGDPTERLLREAQAMARVHHPNVVTVHDVGTFDGQVFLAMEFVPGVTLGKWARDPARDWRDVRDAFLQAGRGLVAAHEAGLVHRDFKLANVIVGEAPAGARRGPGRVVVLDFGLAKAFDAEPTPDREPSRISSSSLLDRDMTRVGFLAGTPPYMAPELYAGSTGTPASDQFAFCVALYNALYGALPFECPSVEEQLQAIERGLGAPPRTERKVPAWLHRVLARGLDRSPARRHRDMRAVLDALVLDARRRRRRLLGMAMALPLGGAVVGAVPWALQSPPSQVERDRVEQLAGEARAAAARGYYVFPPVDDPEGRTAYRTVLELETQGGAIGPDADRVAQELRAEMSATLTRLGDAYYEREGGAPFAIDFYAAALVFEPDNAHAASRASLSLGQLEDLRGKAANGAFTPTELAAAEPLTVLADTDEQSRTQKVRALYRRERGSAASTRARLQGLLEPGERDVAEASEQAAIVAAPPSASVPAPASTPQSLAPAPIVRTPTTTAAPDDRVAAAREAKAGEAALRKGELAEAESRFHRALAAQRGNADALAGLAQIHFERGDYDKAVQLATRAAAAAPRSARIRILLGDAHFKVLAYDEARRAYRRAAELGSAAAEGRLARLDKLTGP